MVSPTLILKAMNRPSKRLLEHAIMASESNPNRDAELSNREAYLAKIAEGKDVPEPDYSPEILSLETEFV